MRVQSGERAALTVSCKQPCFLSGGGVTSSLKVPGCKQSPEKWLKICGGIVFLAHAAELCRKAQGPWQVPATPSPRRTPGLQLPPGKKPLPQERCPRCTPHTVSEKGKVQPKKSESWRKSFECFWLQGREYSLSRALKEGFIPM